MHLPFLFFLGILYISTNFLTSVLVILVLQIAFISVSFQGNKYKFYFKFF